MARRQLKTLEDVRRFLAYLIRKVEAGHLDAGTAAKLGYLSNLLRACIADGLLESRVAALEAALEEKP